MLDQEEIECDSLAEKLKVDAAAALEFSPDDGAAGVLQESASRQYGLISQAWEAEVFAESVKSEKGSSTRPLTPLRMIEEMADRLGDLSGRSVLTFNIEFVPSLVERGAKVTLMTRDRCGAAENFVASPTLGLCASYLSMEESMSSEALKFDVVIGNPPYQNLEDGNRKSQAIWPEFVVLGYDSLKEGGVMAMIHPPGWRGIGTSFAKVGAILRKMDFKWISINDKSQGQKSFGGKSTPFDMYVAMKSNNVNVLTEVVDQKGNRVFSNIKELDFIPAFDIDLVKSLIADSDKGQETVDVIYSRSIYGTDRDGISEYKTKNFHFPCVRYIFEDGKMSFWYANEDRGHFGMPKVMFGTMANTGLITIDAKGEYGLTQFVAGIHDDPDNLPLIQKAMIGARFQQVMKSVQFTTQEFNRTVIELFRKNFWKEFVNENGDWIDEDGNVIDQDGNPVSMEKAA